MREFCGQVQRMSFQCSTNRTPVALWSWVVVDICGRCRHGRVGAFLHIRILPRTKTLGGGCPILRLVPPPPVVLLAFVGGAVGTSTRPRCVMRDLEGGGWPRWGVVGFDQRERGDIGEHVGGQPPALIQVPVAIDLERNVVPCGCPPIRTIGPRLNYKKSGQRGAHTLDIRLGTAGG